MDRWMVGTRAAAKAGRVDTLEMLWTRCSGGDPGLVAASGALPGPRELPFVLDYFLRVVEGELRPDDAAAAAWVAGKRALLAAAAEVGRLAGTAASGADEAVGEVDVAVEVSPPE